MEEANLPAVTQALTAVCETEAELERLREAPLADPAALPPLIHRLAGELAEVWFLIGGLKH
jgi:hypothetical protein